MEMQQSLFERLCPLLIIRMLPLGVFDNLKSHNMYGQLAIQGIIHGVFSNLISLSFYNQKLHELIIQLLLVVNFSFKCLTQSLALSFPLNYIMFHRS